MLPSVDPSKPLQEQFPVSCGSKHREKETVNDGAGIVADVDGSAIQTQPKVAVFAQPPAEVRLLYEIELLTLEKSDSLGLSGRPSICGIVWGDAKVNCMRR